MERHLSPGSTIADYFDLIAGTSTGGIIALGLGAGKTAQEILDLYLNRGGEIFPPSRFPSLRRVVRGFVGNVFDRDGLDCVLHEVFGAQKLGEALVRLNIPAVEGKFGEVHIYKTPHHPDYKKDWKNSIVEVAQATSAAPVFLKAIELNGYALVDGGLFANDPIMVALIDVLSCFNVRREQVKILSLGCLHDSWNLHEVQRLGVGWPSWFRRAYEVTGALQSQNAQGQAGLLIGPENIMRINALQPSKKIELDDWHRASSELPETARELLKELGQAALDMFFNETAERYQPIYRLNDV